MSISSTTFPRRLVAGGALSAAIYCLYRRKRERRSGETADHDAAVVDAQRRRVPPPLFQRQPADCLFGSLRWGADKRGGDDGDSGGVAVRTKEEVKQQQQQQKEEVKQIEREVKMTKPIRQAAGEPQSVQAFESTYELGPKIGAGAFATVNKCKNKRTGETYAVKIFDKKALNGIEVETVKQEAEIMKSLEHPNIVRVVDFYEDKDRYYVVMELCKGGELFDRICEKQAYSELDARDVLRTLLDTLAFCHANKVVHRDIKPENLLLTDPNDDVSIKITDFGLAVRHTGPNSLTRVCGTPGYQAPEVLLNRKYDEKVDLWSTGVMMFILLGGYEPFGDDEKAVTKGDYNFDPSRFDKVSEEAKDLIRRLLVVDPSKRLTAREALRHPWVRRDSAILARRSLAGTQRDLAQFNAKRKFRAAARAVMIANRAKNGGFGKKSKDKKTDADAP